MRLLLETYNDARIYKDRSPAGVPRYIVETTDSIKLYSSLYYKLEQVKEFLSKENS